MGNGILSNIDRNSAIASFQSGGALGYISVAMTERLEQEIGKSFHDIFERAYGTSVGAINATALWPLRDTGEPIHSTQSLRHFYHENTDSIFEKRWWAAGGALANMGDIQNLERILEDQLGDLMLSDFADGLGILVMDADTKEIRVLTSEEAASDPSKNFRMVDLVRASANAPFHFNQGAIISEAGTRHQFTDAGFGDPDQSPNVYWHLNDLYGPERIPYFVSIGAGEHSNDYNIEDWSGVRQVKDALGLQFEISANHAERMMERLMGERYVEIEMPVSGLAMDSSIAEIRTFVAGNTHLLGIEAIERVVADLGEQIPEFSNPETTIIAAPIPVEEERPAFWGS